jgi:carbonic anhydrase
MHLSTTFLFTSLVISTASASCIHGTTLYKRSLQKRADIKAFRYTDRLAAINWHNLSPENSLCATSKVQSPINLDSSIPFASEIPQLNFTAAQSECATLLNSGTNVEVLFEGEEKGGITVFGGETFRLVQYHIHTPSEHRVGDEYFPVEIHFVHENISLYLLGRD